MKALLLFPTATSRETRSYRCVGPLSRLSRVTRTNFSISAGDMIRRVI